MRVAPSNRAGAGFAVAAFVGSRSGRILPAPGPFVLVGVLLGIGLLARIGRRAAMCGVGCAILVFASLLSARSMRGLRLAPVSLARTTFTVDLLTDPTWRKGSVEAEGRVDAKHVQIRAAGPAARRLALLEAGQRVVVGGRLVALARLPSGWEMSRHLAGRLTVSSVEQAWHGSSVSRFANGIRHRLLLSGTVLPVQQRGLFAGFVLGDDRDQSPELIDDFRASGLSHLLVVSGQNVAFTLAVLEPALGRLRRRPRLVATLSVLVLFATVTRFEPSVMRAVWMAGIVAGARCLGRPQKGLRVLALAVIGLLLVDPLLSFSTGFAMSMAATAGLAAWSQPLASRLPLPKRLRGVVAPTLAAQGGVAVVMIPAFGSIPVVSLPVNVVVVPLAAPLMGWGVGAGLPAGILGRMASGIVHLPTSLVLSVVAWSARTAGTVPLGSIGPVPAAAFGLVTWATVRSTRPHRARVWLASLVMLLAWPSLRCLVRPVADDFQRPVERGVTIWSPARGGIPGRLASVSRSVAVVEVTYEADAARMLAAMRARRIAAIDVLVVASGGRPQAALVRAVSARLSVGAVVVGETAFGGGVPRVVRVTHDLRAMVGGLVVTVTPQTSGRLRLQVARAR